jgi:L-cysteate sulfo-lyase
MKTAAEELRARGRKPFIIPLGASTALGAAAYAQAIGEMLAQIDAPDVIVHASSSGGTQAGLVAGCQLHGLRTRVIGISADDPSAAIEQEVRRILRDLEALIGMSDGSLSDTTVDVDDTFVGDGYGIPTRASDEALTLAARTEGFFLDSTYTAKAMAALIARVRDRRVDRGTVLFWHTGGQVGLFA